MLDGVIGYICIFLTTIIVSFPSKSLKKKFTLFYNTFFLVYNFDFDPKTID